MFYVKVHYQKCPTCKQTWSAQLSAVRIIRIGPEQFVCKCGTAWPTGRVEWAHLTPEIRRSYFLSTAEIGVMVLWPLTGGLFSFFIARDHWRGLLFGILGGVLVALLFISAMWALKYAIVSVSLRRCPPDRLMTPTGYGFFDLLRPLTEAGPDREIASPEPTLLAQLRTIPAKSWTYLLTAAICWIRIEWLWPLMFLSMILFMRSLRKLI